ncbi:uncharacterized protein LOC135097994 isoform X4 [Scylla paramamosain]|uniref:uncharacterized protein LOC135097994 isoform X4 n=1 Tax=Scylla paramamosain TaxID=85552 RepID=UPI0030836410
MQQLCLSLLVSDPIEPPPKEAPPKATEEEGSVVILDAKLFYKQQEKEVAEKIKESLAVTEYAKPSSALVLSGVSSSVVQYTVFEMQLSFTVLDTEARHLWANCWQRLLRDTLRLSRAQGWPRKSFSNTQRSSMPLTPSSSPSSLWVLVALSWMEQFLWIYLPKNNLSTIPVDVIISEVSVRYQLAAQVSVVPAGWHLHFVSPGNQFCMCLVVFPENLDIQENSVTKNVQMNVIGWLTAAPQVNPEWEKEDCWTIPQVITTKKGSNFTLLHGLYQLVFRQVKLGDTSVCWKEAVICWLLDYQLGSLEVIERRKRRRQMIIRREEREGERRQQRRKRT